MTLIYTGIGSRETPPAVCAVMTQLAAQLSALGYTLRSGGAPGADDAFETGAAYDRKEIFLPWDGFNSRRSQFLPFAPEMQKEAEYIAAVHHPNWDACNAAARKLHTRNVYQILGADLNSPTKFVICWTKDGQASGGTGQALRIAKGREIPIYNLYGYWAAKAEKAMAYARLLAELEAL